MRRLMILAWMILAAGFSLPACPTSFKSFDAQSLQGILDSHAGQPLVLVFWSASCEPCVKELPRWVERQRRHPGIAVILVNLDTLDDSAAVESAINSSKTTALEHWMLADAVPARVYWSVDSAWHGETPYVRFYDRAHRVEAKIGNLDGAWLTRWLAGNAAQR